MAKMSWANVASELQRRKTVRKQAANGQRCAVKSCIVFAIYTYLTLM